MYGLFRVSVLGMLVFLVSLGTNVGGIAMAGGVEAVVSTTAPTGPTSARKSGAPGTLVLDESAYCRSYHYYKCDVIDAKSLKDEGEKILSKRGLQRLERSVKRILSKQEIDWTKEDWRDHAVFRALHEFQRHSVGPNSPEVLELGRTAPPPENWSDHLFDDGLWGRIQKPFCVGTNASYLALQAEDTTSPGVRAVYLRYRFHVSEPAGAWTLTADYVGGIRVLVNGKEVGRGHLPQGSLAPDALADGYGEEAYRLLPDELPEKQRTRWLQKQSKGKPLPKYAGLAGSIAVPGSRLYKVRNRHLGPVDISPAVRKGSNVLAIEVHTAPLHPRFVAGLSEQYPRAKWLPAALSRLELRTSAPGNPSALQRPAGIQIWAEDIHRRIASPEYLEPGGERGTIRIVGARNGTYGAQVVVGTDRELGDVKVLPGDLKSAAGGVLAAANTVRVHGMLPFPATSLNELGWGRIPGQWGVYWSKRRNYMEDLLAERFFSGKPDADLKGVFVFDQLTQEVPQTIAASSCRPYWLSFRIPPNAAPGRYKGMVRVSATGLDPVNVPVELEVVNWRLPDATDFQTIMAVEQSPYGVAKQYRVPLWSREHFKLIEASLRQLARIGNDWWYVPVIMNTEFGNKADSMIRWVREKDGSLSFDFSILGKYLDAVVKICGIPRVVTFVVMQPSNSAPEVVNVLNVATGRHESLNLGPSALADVRLKSWRAFSTALYAHMKGRGLGEAMYWGYAWDTEGDPGLKEVLNACVPDVYWSSGSHSWSGGSGGRKDAGSIEFYRATSQIYSAAPGLRSAKGWKRQDVYTLTPRFYSNCSCTEGISPPFNYRLMVDRCLVAGYNGIGRVGGDYWADVYFEGCKVSEWNFAGFSVMKVLWPGPAGAQPSARFEALIEGCQEAEARIVIEQALDRDLLPDDLVKSAAEVLYAHHQETFGIPGYVPAALRTELAPGWLERSRRLYRAAAEVAAVIGLDMDRDEVRTTLAPLGQTRVRLKLRNWTDKPRAWKVASKDPWIVPEKPAGTAAGVETILVRLDGRNVEPGKKISGTLTITDVESGRDLPVKISATVGQMFEFSHKKIQVDALTGRRKVVEGVTLLNRSGGDLEWRIASELPWFKTEPPGGTLKPGAVAFLKVVAAPPDKDLAVYDVALSLTAGRKKLDVPARICVMTPYRRPQLPKAGKPIWLLDALSAFKIKIVSHTMAGYNHEKEKNLPKVTSDYRKQIGLPPGYEDRLRKYVPSLQLKPLYHCKIPGGLDENYGRDFRKMPFTISGKTFCRGIWAYPAHETTYDISGAGIKAFAAEVGTHNSPCAPYAGDWTRRLTEKRGMNPGALISYEVYVDGKLRACSGPLKQEDASRLLVVDRLEDAKTLQLVTRRPGGESDLRCLGTWGNPTVYVDEPPGQLAEFYQKEVQLYANPPQNVVAKWAILGPLPARMNSGEIVLEQHPADKNADFSAKYPGTEGQVGWRAVSCDAKGVLRFEKSKEKKGPVSGCGAVVIESPKQQVVELGLGSGGPFVMYLNGNGVLKQHAYVTSGKNTMRTVAVLKPGKNVLMVRSTSKGWKGSVVVTYRGDGLTVHLPKGVK